MLTKQAIQKWCDLLLIVLAGWPLSLNTQDSPLSLSQNESTASTDCQD
jgi:hypothetical protein